MLSLVKFEVSVLCIFLSFSSWAAPTPTPTPTKHETPENRVVSLYVSQDFINSQLNAHVKSELYKDLTVSLDPDNQQIFLRGRLQVPTEEMRAVNLDSKLGAFKFQLTIRPETTPEGYLILEFPLSETFFYPAASKDPKQDRVVIPVQMISLGLASMRGYLAALSGDFSSFDRKMAKLSALKKDLERLIRVEKNPDALEDLRNQLASIRLQIEGVPLQRHQFESMAKEVQHLMGFTGEKELSLNDKLGARKNALIFKLSLANLTPFLTGVSLGGVRVIHDKKDGNGENYLALDINSELIQNRPPVAKATPAPRPGLKTPPFVILRLNQALLESTAVIDAEKKKMTEKLKELDMQLKDDGMHVTGKWHSFFFSIPFDTTVDFVSTGTDVFEVRVHELKVAGMDFDFLTGFVLESMKNRLEAALKGICSFSYVGSIKEHNRALQVTVKASALVPAFSNLHLVGVDVRDREFLLKIGQP